MAEHTGEEEVAITASTKKAAKALDAAQQPNRSHADASTFNSYFGVGILDGSIDEYVAFIKSVPKFLRRALRTKILVLSEGGMQGPNFRKFEQILQILRGNDLPWGGKKLVTDKDTLQLTEEAQYLGMSWGFEIKSIREAKHIPFTKQQRIVKEWPESFTEVYSFSPLEWQLALHELRVTPHNEPGGLSLRTQEIIFSLVSPAQEVGDCDKLLVLDNKTKEEQDALHLAKLGNITYTYTAAIAGKNVKSTPNIEVTRALKRRGYARKQTVCDGAMIFLRSAKHPASVCTVHISDASAGRKFTEGRPISVQVGDEVLQVKREKLDLMPGVTAKVYPFTLATAMTVHMAQSQERNCWPVFLARLYRSKFGLLCEQEPEQEQEWLTFCYAQLYTALSRSRLPPPIFLRTEKWQLFNQIHLANPEAINFLRQVCPEVLEFPAEVHQHFCSLQ